MSKLYVVNLLTKDVAFERIENILSRRTVWELRL